MNLLTVSQKHKILRDMPEVKMHVHLKALFQKMFPNKQVYIGQGTGEFGKDLVIIEDDPLSGEKVTALVVKMGDVSGSASSGVVGTINSQITQAFTIGTHFKEIGRKVQANEVIVIIFGNISNNAKENMDGYISRLNETVTKKQLDDMMKLFDKYYEDVYITANHVDVLQSKYEKLNGIMYEKNRFLAQCYIEPNLQSFENTKKNIVIAQNKENLSSETIKETIFGKKETIATIYEKTSKHKHKVLIQGEAGCGKSIFTIKIIQHAIEKIVQSDDKPDKIKAPILLKSTKLKGLTKEILEHKINGYYTDDPTDIVPNILIIDGIDEVGEEDRKQIVCLAEMFCDKKNISLILTSRKNQDMAKELHAYSYYEILPFEMSQAIEFIKRAAGKNQSLIDGLLKNMQELQHQIPMSAMSLALLVEIAETHNEVPASITELYDRYIDIAVGVDTGDTEITQLFEPRYKLDFLTTISYELFYMHDDSTVTKQDFYDYLNEYTKRHSHITSKEDFLADLRRVSILSINDETVTFSHKSFLDYFIAKYFARNTEELFRKNEFETIYELYYTVLWEDVTNFYFGLKNTINQEQIDRLISYNHYEKSSNIIYHLELYSIGRLLQYAWNTDTATKKYGVNKAIANMYALREAANNFNKANYGFGLPKVFADATIMHYTDFYFSSNFLQKEILELVEEKFALLRDSEGNVDITNELYFFSLYFLVNNKKIAVGHIERFLDLLISEEDNIDPTTYYPTAHFFKLFIKNKKINISDDDIFCI